MANTENYTTKTFIRELRFSTRRELAKILDPENEMALDWRELAQRLPKKPGSKEPRYDIRDIQFMSHRQQKSGESPTQSILNHIGTVNMTVGDVVAVLRDMEHWEAIGILLPDHVPPTTGPDFPSDLVPEFVPGKIREFSEREVAALASNFDKTPLASGGRKIGEGGFGMVFLGYFRDETKCAVKKLFKEGLDLDRTFQQLSTETEILMKLEHRNLIKIYGYCIQNLSIVLEYVSGGDLKQRLECKDSRHPLSWKSRVSIATGAARGLSYLHEKKYVHRDIKSANILLDGNLVPKIADFGVVREIPDGQTKAYTTMIYASIVYQAPETFAKEFSYVSDSYSFGVVLLEIITGMPVFDQGRRDSDIITFVEEEVPKDDMILEYVDKKCAPFIRRQVMTMFQISKRCLEHKRDRPSMSEVYKSLDAMSD